MLLKILIADDDMEICHIWHKEISRAFKKIGQKIKVFEAFDGDQAFETFLEIKPDFVILDVMMPVQNGWETCRRIRAFEERKKENKSPPAIILIVSGIGQDLNEMTSPLYGADDYMDKPLKKGALIAKMRQLLNKRKTTV